MCLAPDIASPSSLTVRIGDGDLKLMHRIDKLLMEFSFADSRMLQGLQVRRPDDFEPDGQRDAGWEKWHSGAAPSAPFPTMF